MWPVYVINLAANTERLAASAAQMAAQGIGFERVDATNGWALSDVEVARVYDVASNRRQAKHPLVRAEIGCYLSHIDVWRRIAGGSAEGGFIFEDDFQAEANLRQILDLLSESEDRRDWDMVKLFVRDPNVKCIARRTLGAAHQIAIPYRVPTCLIGYGLKREAARQLADRAIPFFRPVDEDQKFFWETGLRVAVVLPAPVKVGDQQTVTGTVGMERRAAGRAKGFRRLARGFRGLVYQLRYHTLLHYHRALGQGR